MDRLSGLTATALLGIDTLWGGDVMNPSGTARAVVDSWFSDELLPLAYTHPTAGARAQGGGSRERRSRIARRSTRFSRPSTSRARSTRSRRRSTVLDGLRRAFFDGLGRVPLGDVGPLDGDPGARARRSLRALRGRRDRPAARAVPARREAPAAGRAARALRASGAHSRRGAHRRRRVAARADGAREVDRGARRRLHRAVRRGHDATSRAAAAGGPARRSARQHEVRTDPGRVVLGLHELHRPRAPRRRLARVRGHVRDQRLAADQRARVRAARRPRGRAGPRHDGGAAAGALRARPRSASRRRCWP